MYERFTDKARTAMAFARGCAERRRSREPSTTDILLGLIHDESSHAAIVLKRLGVNSREVRDRLHIDPGEDELERHPNQPWFFKQWRAMRMRPLAHWIIENAMSETWSRRSPHIASEFLLLGMLNVPDCAAVKTLSECGVNYVRAVKELSQLESAAESGS